MQFAEFAETHGQRSHYSTGDHLFRQGDDNRSIYIIEKGLLKAYYLSAQGKERIKSFVQPGDFIGSLAAAYLGQSCSFGVACLEPSTTIEVSFDRLYAGAREDLELATALIDSLLSFAMRKERRERELLTESAEARYRMLLEGAPALITKVAQKDIALYLGITPVALSRIRNRRSPE